MYHPTVQCKIWKPVNGAKMNDHLINWCMNEESNYSCIIQKDDKPWVYIVYQSVSILSSEPLLTTDPGLREDSLSKQVSIINNGILSSFQTFYVYCIASTYDNSVILWFHHNKYHAIFFDFVYLYATINIHLWFTISLTELNSMKVSCNV